MLVDMNASPQKVMFHKIEQHGLYDLNRLYSEMKKWFMDNNYIYTEKENTTNVKDKGTEVKMMMSGERKVTDYFKFEIEVKFLIIEMEKVKYKDKLLDRGKLLAFITATMYLDYRHKWAKNKLSKFLRFIYNNFLIRNQIVDVYSSALKFEGDDLFDTMKEVLGMYNV